MNIPGILALPCDPRACDLQASVLDLDGRMGVNTVSFFARVSQNKELGVAGLSSGHNISMTFLCSRVPKVRLKLTYTIKKTPEFGNPHDTAWNPYPTKLT